MKRGDERGDEDSATLRAFSSRWRCTPRKQPRHGANTLLVGTCGFRFGGFAEVEEWRQRTINSLYNHAGVRRFAYVFPEDVDRPPVKPAGEGENFETRCFGSHSHAVSWLGG